MRVLTPCCLAATLMAASGVVPVLAQTPRFISSHRNWTVYEIETGTRTCYIASEPTKQEGSYRQRGNPAVLVARQSSDDASAQVSVQPGYTFKQGSTVDVNIDGRDFDMFTDGDGAWRRTDADDRTMIEAMRRGMTMTVRGTSTRDTYSLDTYSLNGFTAAYEAMSDACKS
jgi:hypothetical protein